jgi:pimeloyl-ACP methyl ester carboxylesterase
MTHRDPLVLLPAMLTDEALWRHQVSALALNGAVSVHCVTGADTIADQATVVLERAPARFALAGLSLGGMVAMEVVRRAPERVGRLALLSTNPRAPTAEQHETWDQLAAQTEAEGVRQTVSEHLLALLLSPDRTSELGPAVLDMADRVGAERFLSQLRVQHSRVDMWSSLEQVSCRTLVATGRQDPMCPPAMHEEIARAIPGAALVIVEDAGHLMPLERPQAVSALLDLWMQV